MSRKRLVMAIKNTKIITITAFRAAYDIQRSSLFFYEGMFSFFGAVDSKLLRGRGMNSFASGFNVLCNNKIRYNKVITNIFYLKIDENNSVLFVQTRSTERFA